MIHKKGLLTVCAVNKPEGVEKVDTLRQNQDFDEVTVGINSTFHRHKNALKCAVFLVGSEFRLRAPFGERFVPQALPQSCKSVKSGFLTV